MQRHNEDITNVRKCASPITVPKAKYFQNVTSSSTMCSASCKRSTTFNLPKPTLGHHQHCNALRQGEKRNPRRNEQFEHDLYDS
jgi:hypothetical protein